MGRELRRRTPQPGARVQPGARETSKGSHAEDTPGASLPPSVRAGNRHRQAWEVQLHQRPPPRALGGRSLHMDGWIPGFLLPGRGRGRGGASQELARSFHKYRARTRVLSRAPVRCQVLAEDYRAEGTQEVKPEEGGVTLQATGTPTGPLGERAGSERRGASKRLRKGAAGCK